MGELIRKIPFGMTTDGRPITLYRLTNGLGSFLDVTDYGCAIVGMHVHERNQQLRNVLVCPAEENGMPAAQAGVVVCGDWAGSLNDRLWEMSEGEDDSAVFRTEAQERGCILKAEVRFRMKDFDRLVIDYSVETTEERHVYLTHKVCFCLDGDDPLKTHKMRVFAETMCDADGNLLPVSASLEYNPVSTDGICYVSRKEEIRTFAELAADATDLALSAYARTDGMLVEYSADPIPCVCFTACEMELPLLRTGTTRTSRTVYGVDLLYHPGDTVQANPFLFFPQIR